MIVETETILMKFLEELKAEAKETNQKVEKKKREAIKQLNALSHSQIPLLLCCVRFY